VRAEVVIEQRQTWKTVQKKLGGNKIESNPRDSWFGDYTCVYQNIGELMGFLD
jgi:hypothetical protein